MPSYFGVPEEDLTISVAFSNETDKRITFDQNMNVIAIGSPVPMKINVSLFESGGPTDVPGDLVTIGTDHRIRPHDGNGDREVISQRKLFNRIYLKTDSSFTGVVKLYLGLGITNSETEEIFP